MEAIIMTIITTRPFEDIFGWLMYNKRAHDDGLASRSPAISSTPKSINLTSPDVGPSGSPMSKPYGSKAIGGSEKIPSIKWSSPPELQSQIQEYLMIVEDPDAPLPEPIIHGIYMGISKDRTEVTEADLQTANAQTRELKGGFFYGQSRSGLPYVFPRPIMQHGEHRYFFSIVGLNQKIDWQEVKSQAGEKGVGKNEVLKAVDGKVVGWGDWHGTYERGR